MFVLRSYPTGTRRIAFLSLMLGAVSICSASNITYNLTPLVNQIGAGGVTGYIITDGLIGTLAQTDILDYNLLINDGTDQPFDLIGSAFPSLDLFVDGSDLSATATELLFNFSGAGYGDFCMLHPTGDWGVGFFAIQGPGGGCFNVSTPGAGETLEYQNFIMPGFNRQFTSLSGTQVIAGSAANSAPEPSTFAFVILSGVYYTTVWLGRRRVKKDPF